MRTTRTLALLACLALSLGLIACGEGEDGPGGAETSIPREQADGASGQGEGAGGGADGASGEEKRKGSAPTGAGQDGANAAEGQAPASLETEPSSIRGAVVTAKGAVQTLPPSRAAQAEAMENSYSSIKAFGEEAEGAEATDITFALVQYLDAKARGDWATACARIYSLLRQNLEKDGKSCVATYGELMDRVPRAAAAEEAKVDVASVRRGEGNRAFVIYKTPKTLSADMPMFLDGGVWTVGAIQAYALTPEQLRAGQE